MATKKSTKQANDKMINALNERYVTAKAALNGGSTASKSTAVANKPVYGTKGKVIKFAATSCYISDKKTRQATCSFSFDTNKYSLLDHYEIIWQYYTPSNKKWNNASSSTTTQKFSVYTIPANASLAKCRVKPVQKTKDKKGKPLGKGVKWTGDWSTSAYADIGTQEATPDTPSGLKISIIGTSMTMSVDNYNYDGAIVRFQVIQDGTKLFKTVDANVKYARASQTITIATGHKYAARCIGILKGRSSLKWSDYTEYIPTAPGIAADLTAVTLPVTEEEHRYRVQLNWKAAQNVTDPNNDKYEVQYAKKVEYFDLSPDDVTSKDVSDSRTIPLAVVIVPDSEGTWYFRVRGVNSNGGGQWSNVASASVGLPPEAPTTWSYASSVKIGDPIVFNWTHNSADGSKQEAAIITLKINDGAELLISNIAKEKSYSYSTKGLPDGTTILWKVRTKGAHANYSPDSVEREVKVYTEPTVTISADIKSFVEDALSSFPLDIDIVAIPDSQKLLSMDFTIVSLDSYTTSDETGHLIHVTAGDTIYTHRDDNPESNSIHITLEPSDINLADNMNYRAAVVVYMSSGLQASGSFDFLTAFGDSKYEPDGSVEINYDDLTASIFPFINDEFGAPLKSGATLAVYRQNFDGTFTEIRSGISLGSGETVLDEHPTLDYARYRITARSEDTGHISYIDLAPEPVNVDSIVIQWQDDWYFEGEDLDEYTGEMLILPYNVDVSDSNNMDVALIEYIGRDHPVSYYGTQKGYTSNWKCEVPKFDMETIYAIRRLARFAGDVYVREPSGTGYWANIKVQYSIDHNSPNMPVSFTVTRVEGGA